MAPYSAAFLAQTFCICLLCASTTTAVGRDDPAEVARQQAQKVADAIVKQDYDTVVGLVPDPVLKKGGGKEKAVAKMKAEFKTYADMGFTLKFVTTEAAVKPVTVEKETFTVVPYSLGIDAPPLGGLLIAKGFFVGISHDSGKSWRFFDGNSGREAIKKLFPQLPESLEFPKKAKPVLIKD